MTTALNTTIATSSGFEDTWPSREDLANDILEQRWRATDPFCTEESEYQFEVPSDPSPPVSILLQNSTLVMGDVSGFRVQHISSPWEEFDELCRSLVASIAYFETAARGPTASEDVLPRRRTVGEFRPLSEIADDLTADVPDSEWDKIPTDLVRNLDHYLYGAPKDEE